jgi:cytoskeletal protein CcmA (bactofilin family)
MNAKKNISARSGAALLVVLIIVMAITITALGFVSQSDVELACGQNMVLHRQMDYLAESGLEHARGLILNPQDVSSEYWAGSTGLQLVSGSDYYDVVVTPHPSDHCNYSIDCSSYRLKGTERVGLSHLYAELRLDPCIAYWVGSNTTVFSNMTITGDVYCGGNLTNSGTIGGDVFAAGTINGTGTITGRKNAAVTTTPVAWPNLAIADFGPAYILLDPNSTLSQPVYPAGVYYSTGDVNMPGNVTINGTLVVDGKLTVSGPNNTITAVKNFPALLVTGQVVMKGSGSLVIQGLAQIGGPITVDPNATNPSLNVTGGLFIQSNGVVSDLISVNVVAAPATTSIQTWPAAGTPKRWGPAAGAFFKSIKRK